LGRKKTPAERLKSRIRPFLRRNRAATVELISGYIRIPSTHGSELPAQKYVYDRFREIGVSARFVPISDRLKGDPEYSHTDGDISFEDRPNVVVRLRGTGGGRSLIINSHTDVVPADGWAEAFEPRLVGDRLYGRGAADDKGQAGISWLVLKFLRENGVRLRGDLEVQLVIDEEVGGNGTLDLLRRGHRADAAVVCESRDLNIPPGPRGALWFRLTVEGRAAHMAQRHEAVNAIEIAAEAMEIFREYEKRLIREAGRPRLFPRRPFPVQVNFGSIRGGEWPSSVPGKCVIEGGVGFLPPRRCADVRRELRAMIEKKGSPWLRSHHRLEFPKLHNDPYLMDPAHPLVTGMRLSARECGLRPKVIGAIASSDARLFYHVGGMPVVVFGPSGKGCALHGRGEHMPISRLLKATEVMIRFVLDWCGLA